MCPACLTTAAWLVAGSTSAGAFTALVLRSRRKPEDAPSAARNDIPHTDSRRQPDDRGCNSAPANHDPR